MLHTSTRKAVFGPSSGSRTSLVELRDTVDRRDFAEAVDDFTDAEDGRVGLAAVLPGILVTQKFRLGSQMNKSLSQLDLIHFPDRIFLSSDFRLLKLADERLSTGGSPTNAPNCLIGMGKQ